MPPSGCDRRLCHARAHVTSSDVSSPRPKALRALAAPLASDDGIHLRGAPAAGDLRRSEDVNRVVRGFGSRVSKVCCWVSLLVRLVRCVDKDWVHVVGLQWRDMEVQIR